jgi:hypothetical protein
LIGKERRGSANACSGTHCWHEYRHNRAYTCKHFGMRIAEIAALRRSAVARDTSAAAGSTLLSIRPMRTVFVSYVIEDTPVAFAVQQFIASTLKLTDVSLSSDRAQAFAGVDWLGKIKATVRTADVVVLMLSERSVHRPWVNFEAGAAWVMDRAIIPCCYGNMSKKNLPQPYSGIQALDLKTEADYLLDSVCHHLHIPAPEWEDAFNEQFLDVLKALDGFKDGSRSATPGTRKKPIPPSHRNK